MHLFITDKTGNKFFRERLSAAYSVAAMDSLKLKLRYVRQGNPHFSKIGIDSASARIAYTIDPQDAPDWEDAQFALNSLDVDLLDPATLGSPMSDDELLAALGDLDSLLAK